jgi:hypothetical protein
LWITYPWYHPERPRFFNTATLFNDVIRALQESLREVNFIYSIVADSLSDELQIGYENYVEWENSLGKDLQVGANRLTNQQLYWFATARVFYTKFHNDIISEDFESDRRLISNNFHVSIKQKPGFQEAFSCNLTKSEKEIAKTLLE